MLNTASASQHPNHRGVDVQLDSLTQINMPVQDIERAVTFYRDTLGLPLAARRGDLAFFSSGGIRLLVERAGEPGGRYAHPGSVLYFKVSDLPSAVEALRARGVTFVEEPAVVSRNETTETWMAFFEDGEWNTHALVSAVPNSGGAIAT